MLCFHNGGKKSWFSVVPVGVIDRDPAEVSPRGNAGSGISTLPAGTWATYVGLSQDQMWEMDIDLS